MRAPSALLILALSLAGAACSRSGAGPPERAWPAGTVLAVGDLSVSAEEVDAGSVWVERVVPGSSGLHLRRLAFARLVLPLKVARLLAQAEERERARREAEARLAELRSGSFHGPAAADGALGERAEGDWEMLGLSVWGTALDLPEGQWSEVIEEPGRFLVLRRLARAEAPVPSAIRLTIDAFLFPYLHRDAQSPPLESEYDRFRLTIVDPAWSEVVPEHLKYRMGVHSP